MIIGIEHIGIIAENPEKLADWYVNVFGFTKLPQSNPETGTFFWQARPVQLLKFLPHHPESRD